LEYGIAGAHVAPLDSQVRAEPGASPRQWPYKPSNEAFEVAVVMGELIPIVKTGFALLLAAVIGVQVSEQISANAAMLDERPTMVLLCKRRVV
jgi:hypothetical protein